MSNLFAFDAEQISRLDRGRGCLGSEPRRHVRTRQILEALHDITRPVEALRVARAMLADGGSVLVADEPVEEAFSAPAPETDRYAYGWSLVACLPAAMGDPETAATGTVMRPDTLRLYASDACFREVEILPIPTHHWRFYRLHP